MRVRSSSSFNSLQQIPSSLSCLEHLDGNGADCVHEDSFKAHTGGLDGPFCSGMGRLNGADGAEGVVELAAEDMKGSPGYSLSTIT